MALPFLTGTQAVENFLKPDLDRNKESRKTIGDFYLLNICTNSTFVNGCAYSSAVDRGFKPRLGQTKYYKIGIYCFSAKHTAIRRKSKGWLAWNQDN